MGSLGRAITLYGGIERVAIRPAHLRAGGFEHIFQLSDGRDTLMHSRSVPQGASAPQRWTKAPVAYASIAAIRALVPTIFMTPVRLEASTLSAIVRAGRSS